MIQLITALLPKALDIIDDVVPDKDAAAKAKRDIEAKLVSAATDVNLETIKTNQIEAGHRSVWVSGWRPAIGWSCSVGIFWLFVGHPLATWVAQLSGMDGMVMPTISTDILLELTLAMLGMSGLRTFEKLKGISK